MHTVALINPTTRFPAEPQIAAAKKHKPNATMSLAEFTIDDLIRITKRQTRVLVWGVGRLGGSQIEVREALAKLQENNVEIFDTQLEVAIPAKALSALAEGYREVNGEVRLPGNEASLRGRKGAKIKWAKRREKEIDDARRLIWIDQAIKTDAIAAAAAGVPKRTLFGWFGPSGRKAGRRKK